MTAPDYAAQAAAGAAFLDEAEPGYAVTIDLDRLDMSAGCDCVLGQLGGEYREMLLSLGLDADDAIRLGFTVNLASRLDSEAWARLDAAWTAEIGKRRQPAQVTP